MPSVTRRNHGNRAVRRKKIRDDLLGAVERLLAGGESFTELSVERLVEAAGISRSTFYVYFEDKGELLRAWFEHIVEELEDPASGWWGLGRGVTKADLRGALARIVTTYRPHTKLMAAVYDASAYDVLVREEVEAMMGRNIAGLRKHIRKGQNEGWVDPGLLPGETAAWLMWMAERGQHQLVSAAREDEVESLIEAYTDIVWNTLYAFAPGTRKQDDARPHCREVPDADGVGR